MTGIIIAAVILLICGLGFLRLIFQALTIFLGVFIGAVMVLFKAICVLIGVLAASIYLALKKIIPVVANALTWLIPSLITFFVALVAFGRKFFMGENELDFVETMLPKKEFPRRSDFWLTLMELNESLHTEIVTRFEQQAQEIFLRV